MKKMIFSVLAVSLLLTSCQSSDEILDSTPNNSVMSENPNASKSMLSLAVGTANEQYNKMGPYEVSTDAVLGECQGIGGVMVNVLKSINIFDQTIKCTNNFPFGDGHLISTSVYYPSNIQDLDKLPVVNFVGGILSNEGNYANMLKLWASHGFVVVVSSDFINTLPEMHILGAINVSKLNKTPQSPLYGKIDMSNMIVAGHSAGGGASLLTSSIPENALKLIDPNLKITGSLPIEPGPIGIGSIVKTPTLVLTGKNDIIVMPWIWVNTYQSPLIKQVPAWSATATTANHMSPILDNSRNEFAGISVAWLKYIGYNDTEAKSYFVGPNYKLKSDEQFVQGIHPYNVKRNELADNLQ